VFDVVLAGLQAVVELAEEFVEQVSLGLVVPVSGGAAGIEVAAGTGRGARPGPAPRPRPRHRIRGDAAGLAGGLGRPRRGRRAVGSAREQRALPAAQDGRDRQPAAGRRQEMAGHDDRTRCHRLTMRAVETHQSTAASLSGFGKPCGGHPHRHGDNRCSSCGGG
jgi:hypothetical protein